jgi:hypothetical protein
VIISSGYLIPDMIEQWQDIQELQTYLEHSSYDSSKPFTQHEYQGEIQYTMKYSDSTDFTIMSENP